VKSGPGVRVKVIAVDVDRQRIGLTLRLNDTPQRDQSNGTDRYRGDGIPGRGERPNPVRGRNSDRRPSNQSTGSMAQALRDAGFGR
jgi:protein Tex